MKTFLILFHSSAGENPLKVMQRLTSLGFQPSLGKYDLEFDWGRKVEVLDVLELSIKVHETLHNSGVFYKLETPSLDEEYLTNFVDPLVKKDQYLPL